MAGPAIRSAGETDDACPGRLRRFDAEDRILDHDAVLRLYAELLRRVEVDIRRGLRLLVADLDGRIDVRLESLDQADTAKRDAQPIIGRVGADAARSGDLAEHVGGAGDHLRLGLEPAVNLGPLL